MEDAGNSHLIISWLVSGLAVFLTAWIVPGFRISGIFAAILAGVGIGFVNALLWPLLFFLTLPINLLTLGLFTFVVNGAILKIAAFFLPGFEIRSWWSAIFGSIVLSLVSVFLRWVLI